MKYMKNMLALLLILCLCMSIAPAAFAEGSSAENPYAGKDLDRIMEELLEQYEMKAENVYAGYMNFVTGEEHYWQGDDWVVAASMYKVPLNMLYAERMAKGEFNWEESIPYVPYTEVLEQTILYSSNEWAMFMWDPLGGYQEFRKLIAPYMGIDLNEVSIEYYDNNEFTAKQMITCLKTLYEGGDERFPRIIETMQNAEPERFFRYKEDRFNIAQKYGYVTEYADYYMNCCALCFTDEPIAIVMFTRSAPYPEELLTAYCTAMCEYTQYQAANRIEQANEAVQAELEEREPEVTPAVPVATPAPTPAEIEAENKSEVRSMATIICCGAAAIAALLTAIIILINRKKYGLKVFWMLISVAVCAAALMLCAIGVKAGTIYAKPEGDPGQITAEFFDAICAKNFPKAYGYLRDYTSLGLENVPQTEAGQAVYEALQNSYGYELNGECTVDKLEAKQTVKFRYLDLAATHDDISSTTMVKLEEIVKKAPRDVIYDENNHYRPEIANEAYLEAVHAVLASPEKYYTSTDITVDIVYNGGEWQIVANPTLLKALNGGTGY